jgi:hypothetical protein
MSQYIKKHPSNPFFIINSEFKLSSEIGMILFTWDCTIRYKHEWEEYYSVLLPDNDGDFTFNDRTISLHYLVSKYYPELLNDFKIPIIINLN